MDRRSFLFWSLAATPGYKLLAQAAAKSVPLPVFTDVTAKAGVGASGWCTGACFVDYDHDGRLDLIVTRYVEWDFASNIYCGLHKSGYRAYCHPDQFNAIS